MSKKLYTEKLASSGLTATDGTKLKFKYLTGTEAAKLTAKHYTTFKEASFLIPYFEPSGKPNCFWRMRRLETPKGSGFSKKSKKPQRYTQALDSSPRVYMPPLLKKPWSEIIADPAIPIFITEGELKAAAGCKFLREPVLALGGVWNWTSKKHRQPLIPDLEAIEWTERTVYLVFDSDTRTNPDVKKALNALSRVLTTRGASVFLITLPELRDEENKPIKTGLDDFLVARGAEEFEPLIAEAEEFNLSRALWELNDKVIWVRHPTMVIEQETRELMSVQQFRDNYAPHRFFIENDKGKLTELAAATAWIRWPHRAEVYKVSYSPGKPELVTNDAGIQVYNLWPGWGVEPIKGDVSPWTELLNYALDGATPEERRWFEQWIAYQFQHPGVKMYSAVLMWGPTHGTGKSLIGITLKKIFGRNGVVVEQKQLSGDYNKWAENRQFILGDEITGIEKRKEADHIKTLITREEFEVNGKYMPTYYLDDVANWYLTSNHPDALILEDTDRRFFIWRFPDVPMSMEFYKRYDEWLHSDGPAHLFYHLLNDFDVNDFNPKAPPPLTEHKEDMIYQGKTDLGTWVYDLKTNPDSVLKLDKSDIKGDLMTLDQLAGIVEAAGIKLFSKNALARELTAAGFPPAKVINPADGPARRVRPVRNLEKWRSVGVSGWRKHWDEVHTVKETKKKKRKF